MKLKDVFITVCERGLGVIAYVFPFVEISSYFGAKVFLSAESLPLQYFYRNFILNLVTVYQNNAYLSFALMIGIFFICSKGSLPLTKFVRFNVIQAILINIICSCIGSIFAYTPIVLRESVLGIVLANFLYLGILYMIGYSVLLISYGRYPKIPVISEAARLQVQRGYLD